MSDIIHAEHAARSVLSLSVWCRKNVINGYQIVGSSKRDMVMLGFGKGGGGSGLPLF
jgi:hypothetical protein